MCVLTISHWVLLKAELGGELWQRLQFSLHNWLPLLSVILAEIQLCTIAAAKSKMVVMIMIVLRFIKNFLYVKN